TAMLSQMAGSGQEQSLGCLYLTLSLTGKTAWTPHFVRAFALGGIRCMAGKAILSFDVMITTTRYESPAHAYCRR
ncbi:hypothetical protein NX784_12560, partial [Massilia pinisoli]